MIGLPSPFLKTGEAPPAEAPAEEKAAPQPAPTTGHGSLSKTMVGMTSPLKGPAPTPAGQPAEQSPAATPADLGATMTGMGQVPPEAIQQAVQAAKAAAAEPQQGHPKTGKFAGTLMGIAQPGIAPDPQAPAPPSPLTPAASGTSEAELSQTVPAAVAPPPTSSFSSPAGSRRPSLPVGRSLAKNLALIAAGLVAAASTGALVAKLTSSPIEVSVEKFSVDTQGRDRLVVECRKCAPGSQLVLAGQAAKLEGTKATFVLDTPLGLGNNTLQLQLHTPAGKKRSVRPLQVPIAFRLRTDWAGQHAQPPYGQVMVEAPSDSLVSMDGAAIELVAGKASQPIEFRQETLGENASRQSAKKQIQVSVDFGKHKKNATANLERDVCPLQLSSVAPIHQLGGKPVTILGRSASGARIQAGTLTTTAAPDGSFRLILPEPQPGTVQIVAQHDQMLARTAHIEMTKSAQAPTSAASGYAGLATRGNVDLAVTILESRQNGGVTRSLAEVADGCAAPPCLARLVYPEPIALKLKKELRISGDVLPGEPPTIRVTRFR